ncbi:MAG: hypothetical protein ACFFBD_20110, partial [Candidatus Hodarchaeota archaeon]
ISSSEFSVIGSASASLELEEPRLIKEKEKVKVKIINETPQLSNSFVFLAEFLVIETGKPIEIYKSEITFKKSKTLGIKIPHLPEEARTGRFIFHIFYEGERIYQFQSHNIPIDQPPKKIQPLPSPLHSGSVVTDGKVKAKVDISRLKTAPRHKSRSKNPEAPVKPQLNLPPTPKSRSRSKTITQTKSKPKPKARFKPRTRPSKTSLPMAELSSADSSALETVVEPEPSSSRRIPVSSVKTKPKSQYKTKISIPARINVKDTVPTTTETSSAAQVSSASSKTIPASVDLEVKPESTETRILSQRAYFKGRCLSVPVPSLKRLQYKISAQMKTLMQVDEPFRIVFEVRKLDASTILQQCVLRIFYLVENSFYEISRRYLPIKARKRFAYRFTLDNSLPQANVFKIRVILTLGKTIAGEYLSPPIRCLEPDPDKTVRCLALEEPKSEISAGEFLVYFVVLESLYLVRPIQIRIKGKLCIEGYLPIEREVFTSLRVPGTYRVPLTIDIPSRFANTRGTVEIEVLTEKGLPITHFTSQVMIADKVPVKIEFKPLKKPSMNHARDFSIIMKNITDKPATISGKILMFSNLAKDKGLPFRVRINAGSSRLISVNIPLTLCSLGGYHFAYLSTSIVHAHSRSYTNHYLEISVPKPSLPLIKLSLTAPTERGAQGEIIPLSLDFQVTKPLERITDYRLEIYEVTSFSQRILRTFTFKKLKNTTFKVIWKVPGSPVPTSILYSFQARLFEGSLPVPPSIFQFTGYSVEIN